MGSEVGGLSVEVGPGQSPRSLVEVGGGVEEVDGCGDRQRQAARERAGDPDGVGPAQGVAQGAGASAPGAGGPVAERGRDEHVERSAGAVEQDARARLAAAVERSGEHE